MHPDRLLRILAIAAGAFLLPLAGAPGRLASPAPWLGFVTAFVILVSQPEPDRRALLSASHADRYSALLIFATMCAAQLVAVVEFGYSGALAARYAAWMWIAGAIVASIGLALRLRAIHVLGKSFTATVAVREDQPVVCSGPYRWIRHPSYTGAMLTALGVILALGSLAGFVAFGALVVPAYLYRIAVEERLLLDRLGEAYSEYRRQTWRLVPWVV
jgi:protein-S-isoprenylcysteine O-methyltransferase